MLFELTALATEEAIPMAALRMLPKPICWAVGVEMDAAASDREDEDVRAASITGLAGAMMGGAGT